MKKEEYLTNNRALTVILHVGFWSLVFLWPLLSAEEIAPLKHIINRNWLSTCCVFVVFYLNYFVLVDRYFFSNKKLQFYLFNIVLIAGLLFSAQQLLELNAFNPTLNGVRLREMKSSTVSSLQLVLSMVLGTGMCVGLKVNKKLASNELLLQRAKQTQLNAEIKNLKYQIQPHFLFNTLNNIYSLIESSPENAKMSVHNLSNMMRYLLHDSSESKVPLAKEVNFLERFIDLMLLRVSSNLTLEKSFPVINQPIQIAPLLLITFVENAFKHGIDTVQPSYIKINMSIKNDAVHYTVINSLFPKQEKVTDSGIGLENLRKRLEILYPNKFELMQEEGDNGYTARLVLNYKE